MQGVEPKPTGQQLLEGAAQSNTVSEAAWPEMAEVLLQKVEENITSLRKDGAALFDTAAQPPWPMDEDAISKATGRLRALVGQFRAEAPFTIQRLAELAISPQPHYTSLPKYLRALERCLLVSSPSAAFPILPSSAEGSTLSNGGPARSRSSSVSTPLLSPIPFLANKDAPGSPRVDELDLGAGDARMEEVPVALTSTSAAEGVKSPPPVTDAPEAEQEAKRVAEEMEVDAAAIVKSEAAAQEASSAAA